jgi:organic hydroperoxide reductase OsmC/OhrA
MKFPMKFEVSAIATEGIGSQWTAQTDQLPPIPSAIPPEFNGPGGGYSPEDLYAIAVLNCLIATYKVYCEKSKISYQQIQGRGLLTVDKQPSEPSFFMSRIEIFIDVSGCSDPSKGKQLLEAAVRDCAVSNSIKSTKAFHLTVG